MMIQRNIGCTMPFSNTMVLPQTIQNLPEVVREFYKETFNKVYKKGSEGKAHAIAWEATKRRLKHSEGKYVAFTEDFVSQDLYTFDLSYEPSGLIMNTLNEEIVMEAVLANTDANSKGQFFTEEELQIIAEQINKEGSGMPDVDHQKLIELAQKYGNNPDKIRAEIQKEKGIFKQIKAMVHNGKLWIQQHLDKRYKNHIDKFNKLSIEVFADVDKSTGRLKNPKYVGYTLTNKPSIKSLPAVTVL